MGFFEAETHCATGSKAQSQLRTYMQEPNASSTEAAKGFRVVKFYHTTARAAPRRGAARSPDPAYPRAEMYRGQRTTSNMLKAASALHRTALPKKSAMRSTAAREVETKEENFTVSQQVKFDSSVGGTCAETAVGGLGGGFAPAWWIDEFHEPDGTHPTLVTGDFHLRHAERV